MFEKELKNDHLLIEESLFSTANGYIGIRGNFEEGYKENYKSIRGTYINAFHEVVDITYGENAYGFPQTAQRMLNVTDVQGIELYVDGDVFSLFTGELLEYQRGLDIEKGYSYRDILWQSPKGKKVKIAIKRMASFERLELFLIDYKVTAIDSCEIEFRSSVNGDVTNFFDESDPRVASEKEHLLFLKAINVDDGIIQMTSEVKRANQQMVATVGHNLPLSITVNQALVEGTFKKNLDSNEELSLSKYAIFTDSIRHNVPTNEGLKLLKDAQEKANEELLKEQVLYLDEFWKSAKIDIDGDASVEEGLNYNIYQLLSAVGKDPHSNVCAKGLSGEGYEGHYFWDTEIYVLPFFTLNRPEISKNLLKFRHTTLDAAKDRALELGHKKGAKIPWRTISGKECSGYFPAGTAQYHINADVAYSNIQYYLFTKNLDYMVESGYEVLLESARLWLEVGHFLDDEFCIDAVTGPDEYTAVVNNNYYTNAMAKYHLYWTVELASILEQKKPNQWKNILERLDISQEELTRMLSASKMMRLPYDPTLNIHIQDDSFLRKKRWDFENTPKDKYPLLLNFHPLTIYRHQVLKQADVVLAHMLLDNTNQDIMKDSYDYYEAVTTHDSSLSPAVYSMMASKIGDVEKAYSYFMKTVRLDLDNLHGNTKDGLHIANAGGAYMTLVYGFGGLRIKEDGIHLNPVKPNAWKGYAFRLNYEDSIVTIKVTDKIDVYTDKEVSLIIGEERYSVKGHLEV